MNQSQQSNGVLLLMEKIMTPKLEEQAIQQERQLALLATIVFASREIACKEITTNENLESEARVCVVVASHLMTAAGRHIVGE